MSETEVLADIYGENISIISPDKFTMKFLPYIGDENDKAYTFVQIEFNLPKNYPSVPPEFRFLKQKGLDEDSQYKFAQILKKKYFFHD